MVAILELNDNDSITKYFVMVDELKYTMITWLHRIRSSNTACQHDFTTKY